MENDLSYSSHRHFKRRTGVAAPAILKRQIPTERDARAKFDTQPADGFDLGQRHRNRFAEGYDAVRR